MLRDYLSRSSYLGIHRITGSKEETLLRADLWKDHKKELTNDIELNKELALDETTKEDERKGIKKLAKKLLTYYNDCEIYQTEQSGKIDLAEQELKAELDMQKEMEGKRTTN